VYYKVAENCIKPRKNQQKRDKHPAHPDNLYLSDNWMGWMGVCSVYYTICCCDFGIFA
jgi:hypothetical protein